MAKLTDKQEKFCNEYMIDLNATQAAIRAGYSEATAKEQGSRLFTNVAILERMAELKGMLSAKTGITQEWVINRLKEISDRCMQAEPMYDGNGNPTGEFKFDSSGANKATELLGKHTGAFENDNSQKAIKIIISKK